MIRRAPVVSALAALAALLLACGGRPAPAPLEFKTEVRTLDGLRQVKTEGSGVVVVRPGVRMADFDRVLVDPFMVTYAVPKQAPRGAVATLDRETEARFANIVKDAFVSSMRTSRGFVLVDEPGPRAVRVQGWLHDLAIEEPPSDDDRHLPLCFAEVTVLMTVRHSQTAEALAQFAERTKLRCKTSPDAAYASTSWRKIRQGVKPWARSLRGWLEDLQALPPVPE